MTQTATYAAGSAYNIRMEITLTELEEAINYWRMRRPSLGEERTLSPEVNALATIYALMIFNRSQSIPADTVDAACRELINRGREQQSEHR